MKPISYARHEFPLSFIQQAIRLYLRYTLSYRDVEKLLAERGRKVSDETIRRWVLKFGAAFARRLRQQRPPPSPALASRRGDHPDSVQRFLALHAAVHKAFNFQRHTISGPTPCRFRAAAFDGCKTAAAAA